MALLLHALPAVADEPPLPSAAVAAAAEHYRRGTAALDAGHLEEALAELRESYGLYPRTQTLYAIAVVEHKVGQAVEAANHIAAYLVAPDRDADLAAALTDVLAELDRTLGRARLVAGAGRVMLDERFYANGPIDLVVRVAAGEHVAAVGDVRRSFTVAGGAEIEIDLRAPVTPPPVKPAVTPPVLVQVEGPSRAYLWTGAAAVVLAGASIGSGLRTRDAAAELDDIREDPGAYQYSDAVEVRDRAQRDALITNVLIGTTVVTAGAAIALYLWHRGGERVVVVPDGGGASALIRF